jgi:hypothetical protein
LPPLPSCSILGATLDAAGNLYIADAANSRIRVVLANGTIMTVAGNANVGFSGDGCSATAATLDVPRTLALTPSGGFYFVDTMNERIRLLTPVSQTPSIRRHCDRQRLRRLHFLFARLMD